jgi:hypothetical protein
MGTKKNKLKHKNQNNSRKGGAIIAETSQPELSEVVTKENANDVALTTLKELLEGIKEYSGGSSITPAQQVLNADGKPVQPPVLNADGKPVQPPVLNADGNPVLPPVQPVLNADGNPVQPPVQPVLNADGKPVQPPVLNADGNPVQLPALNATSNADSNRQPENITEIGSNNDSNNGQNSPMKLLIEKAQKKLEEITHVGADPAILALLDTTIQMIKTAKKEDAIKEIEKAIQTMEEIVNKPATLPVKPVEDTLVKTILKALEKGPYIDPEKRYTITKIGNQFTIGP